jgi:hypothetical protein
VTPGKSGGGGAYSSGGAVRRQRKSFGAATFVGGEGALVVTGGGDEVLQLGRGEGVRDLQEIAEIGSSGRSSPRSGRRRRWSAGIRTRERGLRWSEAVVQAREAMGRVGRSRGGVGEEWRRENERGSEWEGNDSAAARQRGEMEKGGVRRGVPRGVGVPWGLAPTGWRHRHQPESGAGGRRAPRARVPAGQRGERASNGWAGTVPGGGAADRRVHPVSSVGGRGARMSMGRPEKKRRWAARMHCFGSV